MGIRQNPLEIPGLTHALCEVNGTRIHYVYGGPPGAPAVVFLHGFPQTWLMWRHLLPAFLRHYRVVAADLRGYGDSAKPDAGAGYDKRTMATDIRELARQLELGRFLLIGHDRGARVARRYGLDFPQDLAAVALLDILPAEYVYDNLTAELALRYWHWIFQVLPDGFPERLVEGHEEAYLERFFSRSPDLQARLLAEGAWSEYRRCFLQPGAVAAAFNDYRATSAIDVPRYREERRRGQRLDVPTLLLWGDRGNLAGLPVLDIWGVVASDVQGEEIADCGHYLPEEQPVVVTERLLDFARRALGA